MKRTASEIIRNLERRIARLELADFRLEDDPSIPKVGDILCSVWGTKENRVDFYEVTGVWLRRKGISLQKLESKIVSGDANAGYVMPSKREDMREKPIKFKKVIPTKDGYSVEMNLFTKAHLWDGKKKYFAG